MKENGIVRLKEQKEINEILKLISLIPGFRRASLLSVTFINQQFWACGVCVCCDTHAHTHTHHGSRIYRQIPTTHISTFEPLHAISDKYRLPLPDDGSYAIRNMLE
jgi:hypothetical protein